MLTAPHPPRGRRVFHDQGSDGLPHGHRPRRRSVNVDENGNVLAIIDWKFFADQVAAEPVPA
jgi:hypothetical protein